MDRPNDRDYRNLEERNAAYWREQADKLAVTEELKALLPLARMITLQQAVDAGIHEQLGWQPYALAEGADPEWPALTNWKADAIEAALSAVPVMKEALGNAYETLSIIADAADEDQVKLAAREATTGISQALAALEPKP
jgi:hypothetical protein